MRKWPDPHCGDAFESNEQSDSSSKQLERRIMEGGAWFDTSPLSLPAADGECVGSFQNEPQCDLPKGGAGKAPVDGTFLRPYYASIGLPDPPLLSFLYFEAVRGPTFANRA